MAGGPLAQEVMCMVCFGDDSVLTKAVRVYEGQEDDHYRCEKGHTFGIDWRGQPATEPQWPPPPELLPQAK
ncbi:MAG: hypothetical protein AB1938_23960 [Myxococcota bacterium]